MSGFNPRWLSLREPADRSARDGSLLAAMAKWLEGQTRPLHVLDIGCGTGSTWRSLAPILPSDTRWTLLDHDADLLAASRLEIGAQTGVDYVQHDLNDVSGLPLQGHSVVTASALFDLCSEEFCQALVERLSEAGCGLYAALNYDGAMSWSHSHPLDQRVIENFNRHQQTDKGFGPALGPTATTRLHEMLKAAGYAVAVGKSPWIMTAAQAELQRVFLQGFRQPLLEVGGLSGEEISGWLSFRLSSVTRPDSTCTVGHQDLLAFPG